MVNASAALPPGKRFGTHCVGGWLGSTAGLTSTENVSSHQGSIPARPVRSPTIFKECAGNVCYRVTFYVNWRRL